MKTNLKRFYIKSTTMFLRLFRAIWLLPLRFCRLAVHFWQGLRLFFGEKKRQIGPWWQDFAMLMLDFVAVPELYETVCDFVKWNTRPLTQKEQQLAASVFGNAIQLDAIRLDDRARIGSKKRHIVYVSFFTINAWGNIRPETFIHELVHVWQYQKMGAAYITRALRAQKTKEGYNYGGVDSLKAAMQEKAKLEDFNLEQQADIAGDYYAIREGKRPSWGKGTAADLSAYEYFLEQITGPVQA